MVEEICNLKKCYVWELKLQLCWWHLQEAVKERLKKSKLSTSPYNAQRAYLEFTFIDATFRPSGRSDPLEHEGGVQDDTHMTEMPAYESPNAIPIRIAISPSLHQDSQAFPSVRQVLVDQVNTHTDSPSHTPIPILERIPTWLGTPKEVTIIPD
jgi:hypothetical protein